MNINSLDRFLEAQDKMYQIALSEIKKGSKRSHWMWFIFPQLRALGKSSISRYYGIEGLDEALEYLKHPILSERLYEVCSALLNHKGKNVYEIMGDIDTIKLQSSMTLFAIISEDYSIFDEILDCFFDGKMDYKTLELFNN